MSNRIKGNEFNNTANHILIGKKESTIFISRINYKQNKLGSETVVKDFKRQININWRIVRNYLNRST